jgi:hypothetical protein
MWIQLSNANNTGRWHSTNRAPDKLPGRQPARVGAKIEYRGGDKGMAVKFHSFLFNEPCDKVKVNAALSRHCSVQGDDAVFERKGGYRR